MGAAVWRLAAGGAPHFEDVEVRVGGCAHRLRVGVKRLDDETGRCFGRVIFLREISHEPMQRRFIDAVNEVVGGAGELRGRLSGAREQLRALREELAASRVASPGIAELGERVSRALTAIENWIDVDLTNQRLYAYTGDTLIRSFIVSTGTWQTPTVTGTYKVYVKYTYADMSGPGYYLANVPWVMYFYQGYGIHGTYWHNNFGTPMSHGCINMTIEEAGWMFEFSVVGTVVNIHY